MRPHSPIHTSQFPQSSSCCSTTSPPLPSASQACAAHDPPAVLVAPPSPRLLPPRPPLPLPPGAHHRGSNPLLLTSSRRATSEAGCRRSSASGCAGAGAGAGAATSRIVSGGAARLSAPGSSGHTLALLMPLTHAARWLADHPCHHHPHALLPSGGSPRLASFLHLVHSATAPPAISSEGSSAAGSRPRSYSIPGTGAVSEAPSGSS